MSSNWQYLSLRDCITHKKGFAFKSSDYTNIGTPIVKVTNTTDNSIDMTSVVYISDELAEKNKSVELLQNDIVIATVGSWPTNPASVVGKTIKVPTDAQGALLNQNAVRIRPLTDSIDKLFLYYLLKNKSFSDYLVGNAQGSANQASITLEDIYSYETNIPPLQTQKEIAHILSTLDDKIELNRKMNQTLEAMASAIFKSWFVDFDPVHAKANCTDETELENIAKELGISKEILDLFPSEFEESEIGMIPKGWEVYKIIDKLEVLLGGTPSRSNESYWTNGTVAWINSGKVNEFRIIEPSELITEEAVKKSSTKLLPKKTTVLAITGATLGQVSLLEIDSCANQSVIGLPETEELNHSFVYPCICNAIKDLISHQTGGAQQHINKGNVDNYQIVVPLSEILEKYVSLVRPLLEKISNLCFENQTLEKTRDILLPKLLSGEIDVSELEIL